MPAITEAELKRRAGLRKLRDRVTKADERWRKLEKTAADARREHDKLKNQYIKQLKP